MMFLVGINDSGPDIKVANYSLCSITSRRYDFDGLITAKFLTLLKNVPTCFSFLYLLDVYISLPEFYVKLETTKRQQMAKLND